MGTASKKAAGKRAAKKSAAKKGAKKKTAAKKSAAKKSSTKKTAAKGKRLTAMTASAKRRRVKLRSLVRDAQMKEEMLKLLWGRSLNVKALQTATTVGTPARKYRFLPASTRRVVKTSPVASRLGDERIEKAVRAVVERRSGRG